MTAGPGMWLSDLIRPPLTSEQAGFFQSRQNLNIYLPSQAKKRSLNDLIFCVLSSQFPMAESSEAERLFEEVGSLLSERMQKAGISPSDCSISQQNETEAAQLKDARAKRREQMPKIDKEKFNCAVTGHIGVGKSSLVNALLAFRNGDPGAAKIDCTQDVVPYSCDHLQKVVLWDMPAAGTTTYPTESYYEDTRLEEFDRILVLLGDRVFEIDIQIAKRAKQKVIFVISKADSRIKDLATKNGTNMVEAAQAFCESVRGGFKQELQRRGVEGPIRMCVVSSNGFSTISPYINYYTGRRGRPDKSLERMDEMNLLNILLHNSHNSMELNLFWSKYYATESDPNGVSIDKGKKATIRPCSVPALFNGQAIPQFQVQ